MAMMMRKTLLACAATALLGGSMAGLGLANYAQSGAFDFYKQTPPPVEHVASSSADSAGYYPLRSPAPPPAYPEYPSPPRALTIARPAEPADYRRAAQIEEEAPPAVEEAALPDADTPVIAPHRGSWTAPEDSGPAPAEAVTGDTTS
jgi:hypothetical protein